MSRLTDLIANRAFGSGTTADGTPDGTMPPFLLNILKNFGITPESITTYAETIKSAVIQMRDDIAECKARLIVIEEEVADTKSCVLRAVDSETASLAPIPEPAPDLNNDMHPTIICPLCGVSSRDGDVHLVTCTSGQSIN